MSALNELLDWVANQGFSIAVAVYLLVRLDSRLDKLTKAIEKLIDK
ncbi:unnamed protein product [marine sediment metagenome]|uniref:YvrJ family protein n=1 Tax=marine sediment metagenome TaxID=412755 RepID=X1M110_9ZZZZ